MAITSVDGLIAGCQPMHYIAKNNATVTQVRLFSPFYLAGIPCAAAAPTPGMVGAELTSYAGQIPFINPPAGQNTYVARFTIANSNVAGSFTLIDRLWHNSGIVVTQFNNPQAVNSVPFPARDQNGSINGEGVLIGVEVSSVTGSGSPSMTISYTNSDGTPGRTGSTGTTATTAGAGSFWPFSLQAGDKGVKSIQSVDLSATWTSGTVHLVAYRTVLTVSTISGGGTAYADALTGGMPRLFNNSVPSFLLFPASSASGTGFYGGLTYTQG